MQRREDGQGGQCYGNLLINPAQQSQLATAWAGCHTRISASMCSTGGKSDKLGFAGAEAFSFLHFCGLLHHRTGCLVLLFGQRSDPALQKNSSSGRVVWLLAELPKHVLRGSHGFS